MTRHESRCVAVCLVFEYGFGGDKDEILANAIEYREEKITSFAQSLFYGTLEHLEEIDKLISDSADNWNFARIGRLPLAALRLATYEIKYVDTISCEISVNEAVEICREFGDEAAIPFVNGVLGKIVKKVALLNEISDVNKIDAIIGIIENP
ncbi:MAG: transcription antitermination factor NusB, partial [Clostridia bacterium]